MDPEIFFPERGEILHYMEAILICEGCPVRSECLEANIGERVGIWGGTTGRERKRIRVSAKLGASATASVLH